MSIAPLASVAPKAALAGALADSAADAAGCAATPALVDNAKAASVLAKDLGCIKFDLLV